jgi:surface antigen
VVKTDFKSNQDIKTYTVGVGDTVSSIASKFGVSSDSVRWSNNLTGDAVNAGTKLQIPPVNGIIYRVKTGDTPASLAQTYSTGQDLIVAYNDAEIKGLTPGELILIPGGRKPMPTYFGYGLSYGASYGYGASGVAGNYSLYDRNNCTWWVALRWSETGRPIMPLLGNASQWYWNAKANGMATGVGVPKAHAAAVTSTSGYGHVVFVESVNADNSINISEMNVDGWASSRVWRSTVPASTAARYLYVY